MHEQLKKLIDILDPLYKIQYVEWKKNHYRTEVNFQVAPGTYLTLSYFPMLAKGGKKDAKQLDNCE